MISHWLSVKSLSSIHAYLSILGIPYSELPFDCTGTCKKSAAGAWAYINRCGFCVDGSSGLDANAGMDALYVVFIAF